MKNEMHHVLMDRSAYCVPNWNDCPSNDDNTAAFGSNSNVDYGSNTCYTLSGTGLGVTDYNTCAQGSGMNWCETTGECVRAATCPNVNMILQIQYIVKMQMVKKNVVK
eukprot:47843_1